MRFFGYSALQIVCVACVLSLINLGGCQERGVTVGSQRNLGDSFAGYYLSARFAKNTRHTDRAIENFTQALAKSPNNANLLEKNYEFLLLTGEVDKAIHLARRYIEHDNAPSLAHIIVVIGAIQERDFLRAKNILQPFYDQQVDSPNEVNNIIVPLLLSWSLTGLGEYDTALSYMNRIPDSDILPFIEYQKGIILDMAGKTQEAGMIFDTLLENDPAPSYKLMRAATHFYRHNHVEKKAEATLEKYRQAHDDFSGSLEEAAILQKKSPELRARYNIADMLLEIAGFLYASNAYDNAIYYLHMALYLEPAHSSALVLLASTLEQKGMYEDANQLYTQVPEASRFYWRSRIAVAHNLNRMEKLEEAEKHLIHMVETQPQRHDALLNLADIMMDRKKFRRASELYTQALAKIPSPQQEHWPIFYARGITFERLRKWENAEADFMKALELHPNQPDVLNYLAYSWLMMEKHLEKAEHMLKIAVISRPTDAHILDSYGWALYKLGDYDRALRYLEKANLIMPYDPTTNDHLGDIYWETGRYTEARYQWERALIFDPEPDDRKKIEAKLQQDLPAMAMQHIPEE